MRVVIADDSLLVREGIASLLRRAGVEVVAEADDGEQLQRVVDEHEPDVAIADDGIGGAAATGGSGLRGLADRVEALEGTLRVSSPPGAGTTVIASLPCES